MRDILSDLVAEQQQLDQFLQRIQVRDWSTPTTADGWDIRDTVSHLAHIEEYSYNALAEDGGMLADLDGYETFDDFTESGVEKGREKRPQDVIEWWRLSRAKVVDALSRAEARDRVPWFYASMSARSFATLRMADTWAHGLDIHDAVGEEAEDTERLRHIIVIIQKTLPWAFEQADCEYDAPVRIEGIGPMYAKYAAGPEDTDQLIRGPAGEICRIALQRLHPDDAENLTVQGGTAATALQVMRTY